jgi:hypothetical protein
LVTASLALASVDARRQLAERDQSRVGEAGEWLEFEVVSVDPANWTVAARDVQSGEEFQFRVPPQSFTGQRFMADLGSATAGQPVDVQGEPDAQLERLMVESPLGVTRRGTTAGPGSRPVPGRGSPPGADYGRPDPRTQPGSPSQGPMQYRVEAFDSTTWIATARGPDNSVVKLKIDPETFVGYRFKARVRSLQRGQGFPLLAMNQNPIRRCCTLVQGGGR